MDHERASIVFDIAEGGEDHKVILSALCGATSDFRHLHIHASAGGSAYYLRRSPRASRFGDEILSHVRLRR
jgi:hypothetical protein